MPAGVTTLVTFSTPARIVEFFALDTGAINASVAAFDMNAEPIDERFLTISFSSPPGNFSNPIQFTGAIAKLEFRNPGSGSAWIDDFGFSPVSMLGLLGDYNGDGTVDAADYTVWRDTLGQMGTDLAATVTATTWSTWPIMTSGRATSAKQLAAAGIPLTSGACPPPYPNQRHWR